MYIEPLSAEQQRAIFDEFNITEESLKNDVNALMEWMEKQPHLPKVKDEMFLRSVIIRNKNSLERAKQNLESYYMKKVTSPEMFTNLDTSTEEFKRCFYLTCYLPVPKLTSDGYRVCIFRVDHQESTDMPSVDDLSKFFLINTLLIQKLAPAKGVIMISDCRNYSTQFITLLFLATKRYYTTTENIFPTRHYKQYILNIHPMLDSLMALVQQFAKKDMSDRRVIWKKRPEDLAEVIEKDVLPSDFGGNEKSVDTLSELWFEEVQKHREWLKSQDDYKADLSKRPQNSNANADLGEYGIDGTFRRISID